MRNLMLICALAATACCTQADKDAVNAFFAPIDQAWRAQTDANPLLGLDMALTGFVAGQEYRAYRQYERELRR